MEVLVVGCGIIGLSTAITLLQQNGKYKVVIVAKDLPPNTTSNKAAAVWFPYLASVPADKIGKWAQISLDHLQKEAMNKESGVILQRAVELYPEVTATPAWAPHVPNLQTALATDKPVGYEHTHGFAIEGAVADTDHYLNYLVNLYTKLGGKIIQRELKSLDEVLKTHKIVINCSGLGARELVNDKTIYPTRGQTVMVKNTKFLTTILYEGKADEMAYVIPRVSTTILGGTAQANNWNLNPDEKDTKDILRKAAKLRPEFKDVEVVQVKVGLRPTRPSVRVELEKLNVNNETKLLIHNYGHGGSGFTIGWGCARDVVSMVNDNVHLIKPTSKL